MLSFKSIGTIKPPFLLPYFTLSVFLKITYIVDDMETYGSDLSAKIVTERIPIPAKISIEDCTKGNNAVVNAFAKCTHPFEPESK